jgi:hypothetical protein
MRSSIALSGLGLDLSSLALVEQIALGLAMLWPEHLLAVREDQRQIIGLEHGGEGPQVSY